MTGGVVVTFYVRRIIIIGRRVGNDDAIIR